MNIFEFVLRFKGDEITFIIENDIFFISRVEKYGKWHNLDLLLDFEIQNFYVENNSLRVILKERK